MIKYDYIYYLVLFLVRVEVLSDGSLLIELIMFNYQTYNELKTTTGEVEKFLEQQGFPVGNVRVVGIKDENTAR